MSITSLHKNADLDAALNQLSSTRTEEWVMNEQRVGWHADAWDQAWRVRDLPCRHVLRELRAEYDAHDNIRRSFVFGYQERAPMELLTAVLAWGHGPGNLGPGRAAAIITEPGAESSIAATVAAVRERGAAAGYDTYYRCAVRGLGVSFVTKLLYFAGYRTANRPRPLIYDARVAAAASRLPEAPILPANPEGLWTPAYDRYCE